MTAPSSKPRAEDEVAARAFLRLRLSDNTFHDAEFVRFDALLFGVRIDAVDAVSDAVCTKRNRGRQWRLRRRAARKVGG
jgi:hypothetical protein